MEKRTQLLRHSQQMKSENIDHVDIKQKGYA